VEKSAKYNQKAVRSSRAARLKEPSLDGRQRDSRSGASRSPFRIELDREDDGRFIAEIPTIPGVMVYGARRSEAIEKVRVLALEVLAA
jgi:hypothetical protein